MQLKRFWWTVPLVLCTGLIVYQRENIIRTLRAAKCGIYILYAYKIQFDKDNYLEIHDGVAKSIYDTLLLNDGLYVKFGQGIASMDHVLPPPFKKHLSKLQDKAKPISGSLIKELFEEETGKKIQDAFRFFSDEPVASASIAQVHKAVLHDGREVAVKVQKPHIKGQFAFDMFAYYCVNLTLEKAFDLPLVHFVQDVSNNLQKQLDFCIEAKNSKIAKAHFQKLKREELYVPQVIDQFTRQRILVTEWIEGVKITDSAQIKQLGFNNKQILNELIRAFAEQIFVTGFIHCDPHPGNVFVRKHPTKHEHQIVILDFGFCLQISQEFRKTYATFWKAMFLQDLQKMKETCKGWGLKDVDGFANFQLFRPYNAKKSLTKPPEKIDVLQMQAKMKTRLKNSMDDMRNLPHQLLFVSRNMNLVRSLNKHHGAAADRISILARAAYIGSTFSFQAQNSRSLAYYIESLTFTFRVWILNFVNWVIELFTAKSVQQHFEQANIQKMNQSFADYGFTMPDQTTFNA